ncbi:MAG: peptidoglycan DD-metalloendopeptidase family protein [Bacteroidales bacterium]
MRYFVTAICLIMSFLFVNGQSRKELEEQRKKTLDEINYVDNMIKQTEAQKSNGINEIRIIGNRVVLRQSVIQGLKDEIDLIKGRIELNQLAIDLMQKDLGTLRNEYTKTIIQSYKASKGYPDLVYVFSASDFNQGYKRIKYLQQMAQFRRKETGVISELMAEIELTKNKMEEDQSNIVDLKSNEEKQKELLQQEQDKKKNMVSSLGNKEKQLRKDLEEKKKAAQRIEAEIAKIIEEEKKRADKELSPEMKLIGDNFAENKGRLPWPLEKGIITGKFGPQKHPVLAYVDENNPGIEITNVGKTIARSVFKGLVVRVFAIPGANMSIIIKHGKYYSVYQNLVNVRVKSGDQVETKQEIGEVFCDINNGSNSILKFMIFDEKEKVDPELWIAKK